MKFRHDLFQSSAILIAPRFAVAMLAAATLALAACGGGGSLNPTPPPDRT